MSGTKAKVLTPPPTLGQPAGSRGHWSCVLQTSLPECTVNPLHPPSLHQLEPQELRLDQASDNPLAVLGR